MADEVKEPLEYWELAPYSPEDKFFDWSPADEPCVEEE